MKLFPYKWYLSYCFALVFLTVVYFSLFILSGGLFELLGLFVPIGPFSWLYVLDFPITGLLYIFVIIFADKLASSILGIRKIITKLFFNLYLLLSVTCFIDTVGFGSWYSLIAVFGQSPWGDDAWALKQYNLFIQQYHIDIIAKIVMISVIMFFGYAIIRNIFKSHSIFLKDESRLNNK